MHNALWSTGIAALVFLALAVWAGRSGRNPDDAIAASFLTLALGAGAALCALAWFVLVLFKAASA